jgi:hypothetical protein
MIPLTFSLSLIIAFSIPSLAQANERAKAPVSSVSNARLSAEQSAREPWEICLDEADFNLSVDAFLRSTRMSKKGCLMNFIVLGGSGIKYEVNLCVPEIQLLAFSSIDAAVPTPLFAGSGGCENPLFGADFGTSTSPEFFSARDKIWEVLNHTKKMYAPKAFDWKEVTSLRKGSNPQLISCAEILLNDYLKQCIAFPAIMPKKDEPKAPSNLPPGIHPAVINRDR